MTGEIFWKRVSNAARYLDDVLDELLTGRSVVLNFEDGIPWGDILLEVLNDRLTPYQDTCSLDTYSAEGVKDPGDFLLHRYFSERERANYWPALGSVETFMAKAVNTPMHRRFILITDIPETRASRWISSVADYLSHADPDEHARFVLMTSGSSFRGSDAVAVQSWRDYISEYDCLMLCMNLLSELRCTTLAKRYISELAVQLSGNRLEYAARFAEYGTALISRPRTAVREVFPELSAEEAAERTEQALWEVQIRIVFPELEHFRRNFVSRYRDKLEVLLPITDSAGDRITEAGEIEIGQLHHLCTSHRIADKSDFDRLCIMRTARNSLAHGNTVSDEILQKLGIR